MKHNETRHISSLIQIIVTIIVNENQQDQSNSEDWDSLSQADSLLGKQYLEEGCPFTALIFLLFWMNLIHVN